jgi:hypothetical protein
MNDNDKIEITVGDVRRMAEKCPTAREVLKQGFPKAFEDEWEDITDAVVVERNQYSSGLMVSILDPQKNLYIGVFDTTGVDIYEMCRNKYRANPYSVIDEARAGRTSGVCRILRRKP